MQRAAGLRSPNHRTQPPRPMAMRIAWLATMALLALALAPIAVTFRSSMPFATALGAMLQQEEQADPKQDDQQTANDDDGQPTLDELLNLEGEGETAGGDNDAGLPDVQEELEGSNRPSGPPIAQLFLDAMKAMDQSASRLMNERDAGLVTQRYQEEAILKLNMLIKQAQQQQQQQQQQQGGQQQQNPNRPSDPNQQNQQTQQQAQQAGNQAATQDTRPPGREADLEGDIDETRAEWGNLPERIRELLLQGRNDAPASLYRLLTEQYYRRLAEDSEEKKQ